MVTIDDETLMAYVDGELDDAREARVRERLQMDSVLRERARIFEDSARVLRDAFEPQLDRPVPGTVLGLLRPPADRAPPRRDPAAATGWRFLRPVKPPALALAASLLLAVGVTVGLLASRVMIEGGRSGSQVIAILDGADGWNRGFDTTMSGKPFSVARVPGELSEVVVPLATFLDQGNRYCRSYRRSVTSRPDFERLVGIACRDVVSGSWRTRVVVAESVARSAEAGEPSGDGAYRPAAGSAGDDFERVLETYMTTSPMSAEQEARLIEGAWR